MKRTFLRHLSRYDASSLDGLIERRVRVVQSAPVQCCAERRQSDGLARPTRLAVYEYAR